MKGLLCLSAALGVMAVLARPAGACGVMETDDYWCGDPEDNDGGFSFGDCNISTPCNSDNGVDADLEEAGDCDGSAYNRCVNESSCSCSPDPGGGCDPNDPNCGYAYDSEAAPDGGALTCAPALPARATQPKKTSRS